MALGANRGVAPPLRGAGFGPDSVQMLECYFSSNSQQLPLGHHGRCGCPLHKGGPVVSGRAFLTSMSKLLLENLVQLYLQSSFYCLILERFTGAGQARLLVSMVLGSKKLLELAMAFCSNLGQYVVGPLIVSFLSWVLGLVMVRWVSANLLCALLSESPVKSHRRLRGCLGARTCERL